MMVVNSALPHEAKPEAAKAWALVFQSTDPFGWPFTPELQSGRIIFPTDGCHLYREQFEALARIAHLNGETHCYLAVVEGHTRIEGCKGEQIFVIDLADYESYASLHLTLENAIYSIRGLWGVIVSHEMHAVLGGNGNFVSEFNAVDGSIVTDWNSFLDQWKGQQHAGWISDISAHARPE